MKTEWDLRLKLRRPMLCFGSSSLNFMNELRSVVASLAVTDLLARSVVAHQNIELTCGVSF